jgi:hypothetical protein
MPEISRFLGMVIRMWYNDYGNPHIHVYYQKKFTKIDFDGNIIGKLFLPLYQLRVIRSRIDEHKDELLNNWNLIRDRREPTRITPWIK